jgi:pimeloyl-ACP methyl ester carboxylesterase
MTDTKLFNSLNSGKSKLITILTKNKNKISLVEIYPNDVIEKPTKYLIFSHGNRGNIFLEFEYLQKLSNQLHISIIGYDYIGYGLSEKLRPTEKRCYESITAVIDYVKNIPDVDNSNIYLMGRSLGTGVVIDYVSKNEWNNPILLISPYKSIYTVFFDFPFTSPFISPFDKFKSIDKLKHITCPIKIFHGTHDELINISHSITLLTNIKNKKLHPIWFYGVGHRDILSKISDKYFHEVLNCNKIDKITVN